MRVRASDISIGHLRRASLDDLVDAQNRMFEDYIIPIKSSRQFFLDFLKSVGGDLGRVLLALDGDNIVGYINPVIDAPEGWIGGVGVLREYRGKGIGTKLMLAAEAECRSQGVREISLEVIEGNTRAQRLYERLGYRGSRKCIVAEGKPTRFQGYGVQPEHASLSEALALHERAYRNTCWQRRKAEALVQSAKGAEIFKVDGGFVVIRTAETSGFIPFLGVVPERRRKGTGTALTKFALSKLHDLGVFKVTVYNVNEDEPTVRLLDMFDFKVTLKQIEMKKGI